MGIFPERDTARQRKLDINGQIKTDTERKTKRQRKKIQPEAFTIVKKKREIQTDTKRKRVL